MSAFEPEALISGIPYRVLPGALIEAMMPGGLVRFRTIEHFLSAVDALQRLPPRNQLPSHERPEISNNRSPNGSVLLSDSSGYISILEDAIEFTRSNPVKLRAMVYDRARYNLRKSLLFDQASLHWTDVVRHIREFETAVEKIEMNETSGAHTTYSVEANETRRDHRPAIEPKEPVIEEPSHTLSSGMAAYADGAPLEEDAFEAASQTNSGKQASGTSLQVLPPSTSSAYHALQHPRYLDTSHGEPRAEPLILYRWNRTLIMGAFLLTMVLVAGIISAGLVLLSTKIGQVQLAAKQPTSHAPPPFPVAAASRPVQQPPKLPYPLPTAYGVYALSQNKLVELKSLPLPVPDIRVGISAAFETPSDTVLDDKRPAFIIFRRDLTNNAPDKLTLRVIASMKRETKIVNAKASTTPVQREWRIRNISQEFRVSPVPGHPEMIIARAHSNLPLQPGRYALVFNRAGYDLTIKGTIPSPEFCLEEFQTTNGSVFTQCRPR